MVLERESETVCVVVSEVNGFAKPDWPSAIELDLEEQEEEQEGTVAVVLSPHTSSSAASVLPPV